MKDVYVTFLYKFLLFLIGLYIGMLHTLHRLGMTGKQEASILLKIESFA